MLVWLAKYQTVAIVKVLVYQGLRIEKHKTIQIESIIVKLILIFKNYNSQFDCKKKKNQDFLLKLQSNNL